MRSVYAVTDPAECRALWDRVIPQEQLSDVWEVRDCFQRHYGHRPHFVVCEDEHGICGFLPLSWNSETESFVYFPGETWSGKTWLEQNRLIAGDKNALKSMLNLVPGAYHLRYLRSSGWTNGSEPTVDEIGYHFLPPRYGFDLENYFHEFSGKSAKRLKKEIATIEAQGVEYVYDDASDFETMVALNIKRYETWSYFVDPRFLRGFRSLRQLLSARGWLRMTTVRIGGQVAAVDMGCVFNGTYTLLAGGTNPEVRGVAKLINLHHMEWACRQRLERVDFLCGDFNWKTLFHLTPQPLYLLAGQGVAPKQRPQLPSGYLRPSRVAYAEGDANRV